MSYQSPRAVESGILAAARKLSSDDPSISVNDRIRQEYFRRFLSRIFSDEADAQWMLKGGTGVLARVGSARTTRDIDLYRKGQTIDGALDDLRRSAEIDLGDFFRFEYVGHEPSVAGDQQVYTEGVQVHFDMYVGASKRGTLKVDLVTNVIVIGTALVAAPANGLDLPKLRSHDYRLYPVVDQIADKVCATLTEYKGRQSTREWDLVDLVILVSTASMNADELWRALQAEADARALLLPQMFRVPQTWGARYAKDAKSVPACADYRTVDAALVLMRAFLDPVLRGEVRGKEWSPESLSWG
ncbi:nucleotidyl transferase AbiEii/AbiGii toxin family protein [Leucobacter sp. HY1908]